MKKCNKCLLEKEVSLFWLNRRRKDGIHNICRDCCNQDPNRLGYRVKTREYKAKYDIKYREQNKERIAEYKKNWEIKNKNNPIHKIKRNLRRRLHHTIKDGYKSASTMKLLGCSFEDFKSYIESKFLPGMTWDNYGQGNGKWHIDHIRPCCDFNLLIAEEQEKCFHYSNMQPLWENENLKKSYIFQGRNCRTNKSTDSL